MRNRILSIQDLLLGDFFVVPIGTIRGLKLTADDDKKDLSVY